jgi:hypothetical protein
VLHVPCIMFCDVSQNPPIVLLDEATSALDSESEYLVQVRFLVGCLLFGRTLPCRHAWRNHWRCGCHVLSSSRVGGADPCHGWSDSVEHCPPPLHHQGSELNGGDPGVCLLRVKSPRDGEGRGPVAHRSCFFLRFDDDVCMGGVWWGVRVQDGRIVERGSFDELTATSDTVFSELVHRQLLK